ncbi:MAG: putative quinol monooxygenase [Alphaproteobacteria bacterium]|nr:putative quinol monooxygenase [Alphaproteobacteria bacterium]
MRLNRLATVSLAALCFASCQGGPVLASDVAETPGESAGMILITGTVTVAPENREAMLTLGRTQVMNSRSEEGNVSYGFHEDVLQPGTFIFVEKWRDQAAIQTHFAKTYSGEFVRQVRAIALNAPTIELHAIAGVTVVTPGGE